MLVLDVNFKVHDYHYHDLYQVLTETSHTPKQCAEEICGLADYYLYLVNNLELTDKEKEESKNLDDIEYSEYYEKKVKQAINHSIEMGLKK